MCVSFTKQKKYFTQLSTSPTLPKGIQPNKKKMGLSENMQSIITFGLILAFVSPCLCHGSSQTKNGFYNVINYGAKGDGRSDDAQVCVCLFCYLQF